MTTVHAWFSFAAALTEGSSVFRKASGATVNVTRISAVNEIVGFYRYTEKYVGEVVSPEDGGCVRELSRVLGVAD